MARVLISFLGNNTYCRCDYRFPDVDSIGPVQFVQEAIVRNLCTGWSREDRVVILLTKEAESGNWLGVKSGEETRKGLRACLEADRQETGAAWQLHPVLDLPPGFTPADVWVIFQKLLDSLNPDDEVWFDVTHGFRTLPMVALLFFGYARLVKRIKPRAILYGAFEEKGPISAEERAGTVVREANVYDFSALASLMEWTEAVTAFIRFGVADGLHALAKTEKGIFF